MSARDEIEKYVQLLADWWTPSTTTAQRVEQVYNAVRAEVLCEVEAKAREVVARLWDGGNTQQKLDRAGGARAVEWEIGQMTGEKATASAATATPRPAAGWHRARAQERRLNQLLDAIRTQGGRWHTSKVMAVYKALGIQAPPRATARGDLAALHAAGHLVLHDEPDHRFYTLRTRAEREADAPASLTTNEPEAES